jgi:hypothetical protein
MAGVWNFSSGRCAVCGEAMQNTSRNEANIVLRLGIGPSLL